MTRTEWRKTLRFSALHLLLVLACFISVRAARGGADPAVVALEARPMTVVIDRFYARHHACPQPSRPGELDELRGGIGDGYSIEPRGQFVEIRGNGVVAGWLYYTSPDHPDQCTLWRKLGWDPALIWRRHEGGGEWAYDPGDGTAERPLSLAP